MDLFESYAAIRLILQERNKHYSVLLEYQITLHAHQKRTFGSD